MDPRPITLTVTPAPSAELRVPLREAIVSFDPAFADAPGRIIDSGGERRVRLEVETTAFGHGYTAEGAYTAALALAIWTVQPEARIVVDYETLEGQKSWWAWNPHNRDLAPAHAARGT